MRRRSCYTGRTDVTVEKRKEGRKKELLKKKVKRKRPSSSFKKLPRNRKGGKTRRMHAEE